MASIFLTDKDAVLRYDEQTLTEEQKAQARENIGVVSTDINTTNGMTTTMRTLLQTILSAAVYTSDQSANIELLKTILANQSTESYIITNNLLFVTTDNEEDSVVCGNAYIATLTVFDGYSLDSVTITMGGIDITAMAYDGNGNIKITAVTGDVTITAMGREDEKFVIERIIQGVISYDTNNNSLTYQGLNNASRATCKPYGQYLTKGRKYAFSLNGLSSFAYGVQVMRAKSNDLTFDLTDEQIGQNIFGIAGCSARLIDSGWLTSDYEYTAEEDNLVLCINFRKSDYSNLTDTDYETILDKFTIGIEEV